MAGQIGGLLSNLHAEFGMILAQRCSSTYSTLPRVTILKVGFLENCMVVLLTPWSVDRNWVWVELGAARALGLRIVPILYQVSLGEIDRERGGKTFLGGKNVVEINEFDQYLIELTKRVEDSSDDA